MNSSGSLDGRVSPTLTAYVARRFGRTRARDFAVVVTLALGSFGIFIHAQRNPEGQDIMT